ncbi:MAG: glycosyltransferase [Burkholderiaceae bacterium]|jgi:succinoglycan biosynthesis protein ExoM
MKISICIATHLRADRLGVLLEDLIAQQTLPTEIVIVDNDAAGSARSVIERLRAGGAPFPIHYEIQPLRNISATRNVSVERATSDWIAFIDDDERAPVDWLGKMAEAAIVYRADCVLGPVVPVVPASACEWIRKGGFYDWIRMTSGSVVPPNRLRFGNVLMRAAFLRDPPCLFDPAFGLSGGEDGDLLGRLVQEGMRVVWCDEAIVHEPVELKRLSLRWLVLRALRGGQDFARHTLNGRFGRVTPLPRVLFFLQAVVQAIIAGLLALVSLPLGRHRAVRWLLRSSANLGKLSVLFGWYYQEYAGRAP